MRAEPGSTEIRARGTFGRAARTWRGGGGRAEARPPTPRHGAHRPGAGPAGAETRPGSGLTSPDGRTVRADRWIQAQSPVYLDASALAKLVVREAESPALETWLGARDLVSCALARTEVVRAVALHGRRGIARARRLLDRVDLIQLDDELLDLAGQLDAPLRSLHAIHVAAALELGDGLEALVTYDAQLRRSAEAHGLPVASPS